MKKITINCKSCKKRMNILNKKAKYRCPYCGTIYEFTWYKKLLKTIIAPFLAIISFFEKIRKRIATKYRNIKTTYSYLKQLKKNNPNWKEYLKNYRAKK